MVTLLKDLHSHDITFLFETVQISFTPFSIYRPTITVFLLISESLDFLSQKKAKLEYVEVNNFFLEKYSTLRQYPINYIFLPQHSEMALTWPIFVLEIKATVYQ